MEERNLFEQEQYGLESIEDAEFGEEIDVIAKLKERKKKKHKEPDSLRQTIYLKKDLIKELEKLQRKYGYGFKTDFINTALYNQIIRMKQKAK